MAIEPIDDTARFERLRPEWDGLLEASPSNSLFLTWEWLFTWWKHLGRGRRLHLLAVRRGAELVALAPLVVRRPDVSRLFPFRVVEFLGAGSAGSDYLDLIVRRGEEADVVRALAEHLSRRKLVLDLTHFNRESRVAHAVAEELEHRGWSFEESAAGVCPFIVLAGHSWSSYLGTLGSEHRYNFRRRLKNLSKQFEVRLEPVRSEVERRDSLAALVALHNMRRREKAGSTAFHTRSLGAFHDELSRLAFARGWLRLFVLRLDGTPAAALYGFRYGRIFYFYQAGFDPAYGKYSVGLVTMGLSIKSALEDGAEEYDMLWGDERYKFHWARCTRELGRLELYPPCAVVSVYKRIMTLNRVARGLAKRMFTTTQPTGSG